MSFQTLSRIFLVLIVIFLCQPVYSKILKYGYVKYSRLNFRDAPSIKSKIITKLEKNTKVQILNKKSGFYFVIIPDLSLEGWVYSKGIYNIKKIFIPDYQVSFEFNSLKKNAQEKVLEFKNLLNFDFYKKNTKIIFSYESKYNIGRVFIETEFNEDYYNANKEPSIKPNQIDLYPFFKFTTVYDNFLRKLGYKYKALAEFLHKFVLNILLRKNRENYIILECYKENKLYLFRPYIFLKHEDFKILKIFSDDRKLVKRSYIFTIGVPYLSDGSKTINALLYDFFNINY